MGDNTLEWDSGSINHCYSSGKRFISIVLALVSEWSIFTSKYDINRYQKSYY